MMTSFVCLAIVSVEIFWTKPICKEPNRYIGWPTVCARGNGELVVVFSGDRDEHVCPFGKVQLVRSGDGGETWRAPVTIRNSCVDDRDAGVLELRDGTLLVNSFSSTCFRKMRNDFYRRVYEKIPEADIRRDIGYWSLRSADGGLTWSDLHETGIPGYPSFLLKLKDGRLLSTYARRDEGHFGEYAVLSSDGGRSWDNEHALLISGHFNGDLGYPSTVQLVDGSLLTVYYQADKPGELPCLMASKWRLNDIL